MPTSESNFTGTCILRDGHPVIVVPGQGEVPEAARLQAAINMHHDQVLRDRVVAMIGEEEARRRYPEAFMSDEQLTEAEHAQSPE